MMIKLDNRFLAAASVVITAAVLVLPATRSQGFVRANNCVAPAELTKFEKPLSRTGRLLASEKPVSIVAFGSSSTAGAGASSPNLSYPSRLEGELKQHFPLRNITVRNRGVGGTEMTEMVAAMDKNLSGDKADLVIWQLGTNSLLRDRVLTSTSERINEGLAKIKATGADIILINPQYAPKVFVKPEALHMVKIIATAAKEASVNVFDRFSVMRHWRLAQNMAFNDFLSPDELHMNDWSYGCTAKLLALSIKEAAMRPALTATAPAPAR